MNDREAAPAPAPAQPAPVEPPGMMLVPVSDYFGAKTAADDNRHDARDAVAYLLALGLVAIGYGLALVLRRSFR